MELYLSGSLGKSDYTIIERILELDGYRLCTFAYPKEAAVYLDIAESLGYRAKIMIDSGAFTFWTSGKRIKLDKLVSYSQGLIDKYGDKHDFIFISLDVMPGKRGETPTEQQLKETMKDSYYNYINYQDAMENHTVMPVYHSGEPVALRNMYLDKTDHICLSMNQGMGEKHRVGWASRNYVEGIKIHGLAATGNQMIRYVNWHSVDSAAWILTAAMGMIYWRGTNGLSILKISDQSEKRKAHNSHADSLTNHEAVREIIESKGFNYEELADDHRQRMLWNLEAWYLNDWKKNPITDRGLFDD